jgi:hypothetical protein
VIKHANRAIPRKSRKSIEGYIDPTGRFGTMRRLWELYCGLRSRIEKLQNELDAVQQELLERDPSFFDARHSLTGLSFPFWQEIKGPRRSNPGIAFRNAIILKAKDKKLRDICLRLDSYPMPVPPKWKADFPEIKNWVAAFEHKRCRPRLEKLISDVRAHARLL